MIHGNKGTSSYFNGEFADYGRNQWNVKLPSHSYDDHNLFADYFLEDQEFINNELGFDTEGKPIKFRLAGRSGGWLVSDNALSQAQLDYINSQVKKLKAGKFNHLLRE